MPYKQRLEQLLVWVAIVVVACCLSWSQTKVENAKTAAADQSSSGPSTAAEKATTRWLDDPFVIGADDVLSVNVWKEAEVSRVVTVRSDGKIALALVGELQAAGLTPRELEGLIRERLSAYVADPVVTVITQEIHSRRFSILGNISRPGSYPLNSSMSIIDAIALAGGFRDFAKQKGVYLLRQNSDRTQSRLAFNYRDFIKGKNPEQNVNLKPNDTIIVP